MAKEEKLPQHNVTLIIPILYPFIFKQPLGIMYGLLPKINVLHFNKKKSKKKKANFKYFNIWLYSMKNS